MTFGEGGICFVGLSKGSRRVVRLSGAFRNLGWALWRWVPVLTTLYFVGPG